MDRGSTENRHPGDSEQRREDKVHQHELAHRSSVSNSSQEASRDGRPSHPHRPIKYGPAFSPFVGNQKTGVPVFGLSHRQVAGEKVDDVIQKRFSAQRKDKNRRAKY